MKNLVIGLLIGILFLTACGGTTLDAPGQPSEDRASFSTEVVPTAIPALPTESSPFIEQAPLLLNPDQIVATTFPIEIAPAAGTAPELKYVIKALSENATKEQIEEAFREAGLNPSDRFIQEWITDQLQILVPIIRMNVPGCAGVDIVGDTTNWEPVPRNSEGKILWARHNDTREFAPKAVMFTPDGNALDPNYHYETISPQTDLEVQMLGDNLFVYQYPVSVKDMSGVMTETMLKWFVLEDGQWKQIWNEQGMTALARDKGYDVGDSLFDRKTGLIVLADGKGLKYENGALVETEVDLGKVIANFEPGSTPENFEYLNVRWMRSTDEQGQDIWRAYGPDGAPAPGMEHVSMEHVEAYYDRVEMFGTVYDLGKVKLVVTPDYPAFYDFTKSGKTMEALGKELWSKLRSDARDPKIIQALDNGAPITVFLGSWDKADRLPSSPDSSYPLRSILNENNQILGELVCQSGNLGIITGPMVDADGRVVVGIFPLDAKLEELAKVKSTSVDVISFPNSPFVKLGVAMRYINMVEHYAPYYADENPADVVNAYAKWVQENAEIVWIE